SHHDIAVYKPAADGIEPWLNLNNAARLLQVAPKTLRVAAEAGRIEALHPLPDGPWIFSRAVLSTAPACAITERTRQNPKAPRGIASRSAKPVLFNDIDRWVLRCALVVGDPSWQLTHDGFGIWSRTDAT